MSGEVAIGGVFVPWLLLLAFAAALVTMGLMAIANRLGLYRFVAYRALVDVCLFVAVLAILVRFTIATGLQP